MPDGAAPRRPVLKVKLAAAILKCVVAGRRDRAKRQKEAGGRAVSQGARAPGKCRNHYCGCWVGSLFVKRADARSLSFLALCLIHCDGRLVGRSPLRVAAARSEKASERVSERRRRRKAGSTFHVLIYSLLLFGAVYINVGRMNLA